MFENFTLSTNIAGDCAPPFINNASKGTCAYIVPGTQYTKEKHVFTSSMVGICTTSEATDGADDGQYNGICYDVPTAGMNLFNS